MRPFRFCIIHLILSGPSSHRAASGSATLQRRQRSQSLERPAKTSHQDKMTGSLPRPNNYNISDPDMIASKLAEQEYLQSLGIKTIIPMRDLERNSFEQILLVFYTKALYLFCLPTTDSIHIKPPSIRNVFSIKNLKRECRFSLILSNFLSPLSLF